ncbi:MAG TPA: SRPBCC family protein [Alphaproteobacteria bacterium]
MQFENSFDVPVGAAEAWALLIDIRRIAPCMPGAELTEVVDPRTYKGKLAVKLGPVALSFAGTVQFESMDEAQHTARVKAQGSDQKGRGGAHADVTFRLVPEGSGARVLIATNVQLSGSVAQYGRGAAMIQDLAQHMIDQFAARLREQLATEQITVAGKTAAAAGAPTPIAQPAAPPVQMGGIGLKVLWRALLRALGIQK